LRVETPNDCWTLSDDIKSSWPRLRSPKVNEEEACSDVIKIKEGWVVVPVNDRWCNPRCVTVKKLPAVPDEELLM